MYFIGKACDLDINNGNKILMISNIAVCIYYGLMIIASFLIHLNDGLISLIFIIVANMIGALPSYASMLAVS